MDFLKQVYEICVDKPNEEYSLLKVLEVEDKEVMMCRVLADVLNPKGLHKQGHIFLQTFIQDILHYEISENEIQEASVYKEYLIENDRRIDIVIKWKNHFIPIEVKIHAGDQPNQCYDYYKYACRYDNDAEVVYLTVNGSSPSKDSIQSYDKNEEVPEGKIKCISFKNDVRTWLEKYLENEKIGYVCKQYIEAINYFSNRPDQEKIEMISDVIVKNEENMISALGIAESIDLAKAKLMYKLFEEIEMAMKPLGEKYHLERDKNFQWYEYEDKATKEFYEKGYSTYPGINYRLAGIHISPDIDVWFRIEIDYCLFAGFCLFNKALDSEFGKGNQQDEITEELRNKVQCYFNEKLYDTNSWWLMWKYLPTGISNKRINPEDIPDFKGMNTAAVSLANPEKRKAFISKVISVLEKEFLSLIKKK